MLILSELLSFLGERPLASKFTAFTCGDTCLFSVFNVCFLLTAAGKYNPPVVSNENEVGNPLRETGESNKDYELDDFYEWGTGIEPFRVNVCRFYYYPAAFCNFLGLNEAGRISDLLV